MADRYDPAAFEAKWRERWRDADLFKTRENPDAPKFYGLDFFPYPSGAGLSVGHCRNYVPTDVVCRMKLMQGFNVLHPMGFDAFGLPAENEAIKRKSQPAEMIERYADRYRKQMDLIGISYDWSRSFKSSDPDYYRWTQWIFELLFKRGLAYRKMATVNWDPVDKTVLADEEVVAGRADRSGALVEKKLIPQWFFKITDYAQRLIDDLDSVDWPEGIKHQQKNWIGRSEGVQFSMKVVFSQKTGKNQQSSPMVSDEASDLRSSEVASAQGAPKDPELAALEDEIRASGYEPTPRPGSETWIADVVDKGSRAAGSLLTNDWVDDLFARTRGKIGDIEVIDTPKPLTFEVFTTRIDTIFGMTFCVLAPEHPIVEKILANVSPEHVISIREYQTQSQSVSDAERQADTREKTGVFTGAFALNPATGKPVPIWIADYVLATYGTGAIMAVPGHDKRDFDFAVKYELPILPVIKPSLDYFRSMADPLEPLDEVRELARYLENPKAFDPPFVTKEAASLINSGEFSGLSTTDAIQRMAAWIESNNIGKRKVQYKLRDWLISRQRYWGCPIPIIHTKDGEMQLAPEASLPVELPMVDNYEPSGSGESPLASIPEFVNVTDLDGRLGRRETDTMGGFACSSWYFLRFCDPHNEDRAWDPEKTTYWMPVDRYVGGAEHAVMHLLYARFWTKVLYDAGLVSVKEPFQALHNQGQVLGLTPYRKPRAEERLGLGEEGILISPEEATALDESEVFYRWARMSKSKGNVVSPEEAVERCGADALRLYLLFKAPFDADINWENKGMEDLARFLSRVFRIVESVKVRYEPCWKDRIEFEEADENSIQIRRLTHKTIKNVTADIDRFGFNTYISKLMIFVNDLNPHALPSRGADQRERSAAEILSLGEAVDALILMLAPAAPHSADELWESLGHKDFTVNVPWPRYDEKLIVEATVTVAVQVNGKLRGTFEIEAGSDAKAHEEAAIACEKVKPHLEGKAIRKMIVVPGKLVNIVAN